MLGAVSTVDVLDDLLPPFGREVDVDVGVARSTFVDESLEQQVVPDGIDPGDAEHVGHDRVGGTSPTLGRDPALTSEPHDVPADQEELGQAGLLDDVELVRQLLHDRRRDGVIAAAGAHVAQLLEVRKGRVALRDLEAGKAIAFEPEVDRAAGGQLAGITDSFSPGGGCSRACPRNKQPRGCTSGSASGRRHQLVGRFQIRLAVRAPQIAQLAQRAAVADRRQDVVHLPALGIGVVDVVRDHDRQPELFGQTGGLGHEPVVVRQQVVLHLQEERGRGGRVLTGVAGCDGPASKPVACEEPRIPLRRGPCSFPVAGPQAPGDLALAASGEGHQAVRVLGQQRVAEARHRFRSGQVRAADESAQAAIARRVAGQQDEMRAALPLSDATQILLHRVAVAGQQSACRTGPGRQPLPVRTCKQVRLQIGHGCVDQLYLDPDDRPQARLLSRGGKANHAVEPVVVRDRQTGQTQLHGALNQLVRRRGAVEEREVRVAVELGVGGHPGSSASVSRTDARDASCRRLGRGTPAPASSGRRP